MTFDVTVRRRASLAVAVLVAALPNLELAITGSMVVLVAAWLYSSVVLTRQWHGLPRPLRLAHYGVSLLAIGSIVRMVESALAGGHLSIPSYADTIVIPGFVVSIVGLIGAAQARAATARLGDMLDAVATSTIPIGYTLLVGRTYIFGNDPWLERGTNLLFVGFDTAFLVVMLILIYGPGQRLEGAIWVAAAGLVAAIFDLLVFVGLALDAPWQDQPLRLVAAAFLLYAIGASYPTFAMFASPGTRPQQYRWQLYAVVGFGLIVLVALDPSIFTLGALGVFLVCAVGRLGLTGLTARRLTNIIDTQSQLGRDLASADTVRSAVDAGLRACRNLARRRRISINWDTLIDNPDLTPTDLSGLQTPKLSIKVAQGGAIEIHTDRQVAPYVQVAFEQVANVLDFAIASIHSRNQRAEAAAREAVAEATAAAQAAWQALSVNSQEVGLHVIGGQITRATPNAADLLGFEPVGRAASTIPVLTHPLVDRGAFEDPVRPGIWVKVTHHAEVDGSSIYTVRNVTDEVIDARTDAITGLRNHADFEAMVKLEHCIVAVFHLHDIPTLNEARGKATGDKLLRELTGRLRANLRSEHDRIWRGQGPTLIVAACGTDESEWIEDRRRLLTNPVDLGDHMISPSITVGAVEIHDPLPGASALIRANTALHHALDLAPNTTAWFTEELYDSVQRRWAIEASFSKALKDPGSGGFSVHYQPLVEATTAMPVAAEALARWMHPELGPISPGEFIPIAEKKGLVDAIDNYVLETVLRDMEQLHAFHPDFKVHVNMSPVGPIADKLQAVRRSLSLRSGAHVRALVLEMTESGLTNQELGPLAEACNELRELGVRISLDDFGTGQSNFDRIAKLPFDEIKLAKTFAESEDIVLMRSMVQTIHELGMESVAENIETTDQQDRAVAAGVDYLQGYLFSKPEPLARLVEWMRCQLGRPPLPIDGVIGPSCSEGEHSDCHGWWPDTDTSPTHTCACPCHARNRSWPAWEHHRVEL